MRRMTFVALLCALCCAAGAAALEPGARTKAAGAALQGRRINGTVVGVGGRFGGRSYPFTLIVNDYTGAGDVERLNSALKEGGEDDLLRTLSRMDAGRIQIGNNVGVPANAVIATRQAEGGTRLVVLYERQLGFYELRYGTRSSDYKFGYAEIFLNRNGTGQGTLIPAAKVRLRDGNIWEVEDFGSFPARLIGLRSSGGIRAR